MELSRVARQFYGELAQCRIIDAHEYLPAEADYLARNYSGLNLFADHLQLDLRSAGLQQEVAFPQGNDMPLAAWWPRLRPHWQNVQHTGFAQALLITLNDLYAIREVNDRTILDLAARVGADNTPGLYQRVLQERCRIRWSLTATGQTAFPNDPALRGLTTHPVTFAQGATGQSLAALATAAGASFQSLEEVVAALQDLVWKDLRGGAVGLELYAMDLPPPDEAAAAAEVVTGLAAPTSAQPLPWLAGWLVEKCLDVAAAAEVPVAVRAGRAGDARVLDPNLLWSVAPRRPELQFDLLPLGLPLMRDAMLLAKALPNVSLNLSWCPVISPVQTMQALDEILDLVPVNKVIAFGGEYQAAVQMVYGHLVIAREVVAVALAKRMESDELDRGEALRIARLWFHDNPSRIYKLA